MAVSDTLPIFAITAVGRLAVDASLRSHETLDEFLDGYARFSGVKCDDETRKAAHEICVQRGYMAGQP